MCVSGKSNAKTSMSGLKQKGYTYADVRKHNQPGDAWIVIWNKVYDISQFDHPAGSVINQSFGRESTLLYESHHVPVKNINGDKRFEALLAKYYIGDLVMPEGEELPVHPRFDTPFGKELVESVQKHFKERGVPTRDHPLSVPIALGVVLAVFYMAYLTATTGSLFAAAGWGLMMAFGHLVTHSCGHHQVTSYSGFNSFVFSVLPDLWGMSNRYWEFSHNLSHHMYCYNDKDYMVEQHVPASWFRIYEDAEWKPYHRFQHIYYMVAPLLAFFYGGTRPTCAPFVFAYPILQGLFNRKSTPLPCPSFMATGSTHYEEELNPEDDGVGKMKTPQEAKKFVMLNDNTMHTLKRLFLGSVMTLPVWLTLVRDHGYVWATFVMFFAFGTQSGIAIKSLLLQHLAEGMLLVKDGFYDNDWWKHQIVTSVDVDGPANYVGESVLLQVLHHLFPCMNGFRLRELKPIVEELARKHKLPYASFAGAGSAHKSGFAYLKRLSVDPATLKKAA